MSHEIKTCPFCGGNAKLIVEIKEDNHKYPRDHWHARVECIICYANQCWHVVSKQEADEADPKLIQSVINLWNDRVES